ncbi:MAG: cell division protein ZapA [Saprospirales bacterium]|nr:MAG: cell division protein ZapA [Saprospirales bacterium]
MMDDKDLQSISVTVCGRAYPLRVESGEVEMIHIVAKEINEKVREFQLKYKDRDLQDFLVMTLLTYAVENHKSDSANSSDEILKNQLVHLNETLSEALA